MLEKRVAAIGKLCFGLAGMLAGDAKSAMSVAEVAAGAIDRASGAGKQPEAVMARMLDGHRRTWGAEYAGSADRAAIEAVEALLADSLDVVLDPEALTAAAFDPRGLHEAAAAGAAAALGLDDPRQHPEAARRYAAGLLAAGLKTAFDAGGLFERFAGRLALEQARRIGSMQAKLDQVDVAIRSAVPRELLESLALRFDYGRPDAPVAELAEFLKAKASEWQELKARLAALEAEDPRIANARAAAQASIAAGDFDAADAILAGAEDLQQEHRTLVEVRRQAGLRQARAEALLLKGDADGAAAHFETAAGFLLPFAAAEGAVVRNDGALRLSNDGLRLGGTGLLQAIDLYRRNEAIWTREADPLNWALTKSNLASALARQAERTEGVAGVALLAESVAACRAALEVRTRAAHPADWANTQNNLGAALSRQAERTEGAARAALLAEAAAALRAALEVHTKHAYPAAWAMTQHNLGAVLRDQAGQTKGPAGATLLAEAAAAYRAALEVSTRKACPLEWAMAQTNLGAVLAGQAGRTGGPAGSALLVQAVEAHRAALEICTREAHPLAWAAAQTGLGASLVNLALRTQGGEGTVLVAEAVTAQRGALEVYTREAHPRNWAMAQGNLGLSSEALGDRGDEPARRYREAAECLEAASEAFGACGMESDRANCARIRARVAGKLAAVSSAE
jgi:hypothetical protein